MAWRTHKLWRCSECGRRTYNLLQASHPWLRGVRIFGCPHCFAIDTDARVCDVEGCTEPGIYNIVTENDRVVLVCAKHLE